MPQVFLGNADSVVFHLDERTVDCRYAVRSRRWGPKFSAFDGYVDIPSVRERLDGIGHQVRHDLFNLGVVNLD